jgi:hypothetical protein
MIASAGPANRRFVFETDTFAFANELVWQYRFDPVTGRMSTRRTAPPPTYAHRCFVMVRAARQFFYHARFDAALPVAPASEYESLVRRVMRLSSRQPSPEARKIVIPGYDGLRSCSLAQERIFKRCCGGAWQSYALRSHWRMVFPLSRRHQEATARALTLETRVDPILHLVRFPALTINHGITLFERREEADKIQFRAYDPNQPQQPVELTFDRNLRTFFFPANHYWGGGRVDVIEVYRHWLF